ncbi:MAG: hypothetical protein LBH31_03650, partial [Burkholderiaceae bacterium]|nr:hypothetical protein [Burkholderiaceae bacterium]
MDITLDAHAQATPLTSSVTAGAGTSNVSATATPNPAVLVDTSAGSFASAKTVPHFVSGYVTMSDGGITNWVTVNFNFNPTALSPSYDPDQAQIIQVTCVADNGGDCSNAYLIGFDGTNTYELIAAGNIGSIASANGADDPNINQNSIGFFATSPGTYTLTFNVYQMPVASYATPTKSDWAAGTILGTSSISITVGGQVALAAST